MVVVNPTLKRGVNTNKNKEGLLA